jgi:hypothetical protein
LGQEKCSPSSPLDREVINRRTTTTTTTTTTTIMAATATELAFIAIKNASSIRFPLSLKTTYTLPDNAVWTL